MLVFYHAFILLSSMLTAFSLLCDYVCACAIVIAYDRTAVNGVFTCLTACLCDCAIGGKG